MSNQWINGIPGGSITFYPDKEAFLVRFQGESSRTFSIYSYGDLGTAENAALKYKRQMSEKKDITKEQTQIFQKPYRVSTSWRTYRQDRLYRLPKLIHTWGPKRSQQRWVRQP